MALLNEAGQFEFNEYLSPDCWSHITEEHENWYKEKDDCNNLCFWFILPYWKFDYQLDWNVKFFESQLLNLRFHDAPRLMYLKCDCRFIWKCWFCDCLFFFFRWQLSPLPLSQVLLIAMVSFPVFQSGWVKNYKNIVQNSFRYS